MNLAQTIDWLITLQGLDRYRACLLAIGLRSLWFYELETARLRAAASAALKDTAPLAGKTGQ